MERKPEDITADNYTTEDLGGILEDHADDAVPYCEDGDDQAHDTALREALERLYYLSIQSRDWARAFELAAEIEDLTPSVY